VGHQKSVSRSVERNDSSSRGSNASTAKRLVTRLGCNQLFHGLIRRIELSTELTKEAFLRCVEKHEMEVLLDNGVYRHLRFKAPDTGNQHFHLVTFPGRLVYCGDMGSYLFERTTDMFGFFRRPDRGINLSYWSEKVDAQDRDGIKEFSLERAKEIVKEIVKEQAEYLEESEKSKIDEELELLLDEIDMDANDVGDVMRVASDFNSDVIDGDWFSDLWDYSTQEYTYRFQWACYAIAWGIEQYDKQAIPNVAE